MKTPMVLIIHLPICFENSADGGFVVCSCLFEAGEIVSSKQVLSRKIHLFHIQFRPGAQMRVLAGEGVFGAVYVIGVFPASGIEPGVEVRLCQLYPVYHYCIW